MLTIAFAFLTSITQNPLRLVEERRISGAREDLTANSGAPAMVVTPRGGIVFFDELNARFIFFDSAGKRGQTFGRKGAGPGEFAAQSGTFRPPTGPSRQVESFMLSAGLIGDTIWVYDRMQRRFTVISPQARLLRTAVLPTFDASSVIGFAPIAYYGDGRILGELSLGTRTEFREKDGDKGSWWSRGDSDVVMSRADGTIERRVLPIPENRRSVLVSGPGVYSFAPVPFEVGPLRDVAQSGDRFVYVTHTNGTYRVTVIGARGDTLLSREYPYTTTPIAKRRADSAFAAAEKSIRSNNRDRTVTDALLKQIRANIPATEAPFRGVTLGVDGTIWLALPSTTEQHHLVLDERGTTLGIVTLPGRPGQISLREASRTAVWATARDADGFIDIIRYRVESPR